MALPGGAFKDVLLAVGIVAGVLGGLFVFTGVWPPMVVVESGSMMHAVCVQPGEPDFCDPGVGFGKLGTIDPGDMVFVKKAGSRDELTAMADAAARNPGERNYGAPGDVVVYYPFNQRQRTPIIHRAIAWVEVSGVDNEANCERTGNPGSRATYSVFWEGQQYEFDSRGIFLPEMGFGAPAYREDQGYRPCWSGFITQGDNPVTNTSPDQALGGSVLPSQPVRLEWIEGKAVGELPWFGLIKLALSNNLNYGCRPSEGAGARAHDPACAASVRVINANAPSDLWASLGISLAAIAIAPLAYDMYLIKRNRAREEAKARGEPPPPSLGERIREGLGMEPREEALDGPEDLPPDGSADPSRAFEPPRESPSPPPARPVPRPASRPARPPEDDGKPAKAKFERVEKKKEK